MAKCKALTGSAVKGLVYTVTGKTLTVRRKTSKAAFTHTESFARVFRGKSLVSADKTNQSTGKVPILCNVQGTAVATVLSSTFLLKP